MRRLDGRYDRLHRTIERLEARYGAEAVRAAVDSRPPVRARRLGGRPRDFDQQKLINLYLFIESLKIRTGKSAYAVCRKARFEWVEAGGPNGAVVTKSIGGETLRRRYQEARALVHRDGRETKEWLAEQARLWVKLY